METYALELDFIMNVLSPLAGRTLLVLTAVLLTACGSDPTNPVPPPTPPPAVPPPPPPPPPPPAPPEGVVLDREPLGPGGGELQVTEEGALQGLTISVPGGAFTSTTTWTVTERPALRPTLPTGVLQVGPAIQIENGQGYSEEPFLISVPARVSADTSIALFYYEESSGTFELVPVLKRTDTSLVVMTRHVSGDELLVRGGSAFRLGASAVRSPGLATLILVAAAGASMRGTFQSGFVPGVDDWEFSNAGDYLNPNGYCGGASLAAIHHYYTRKATRGSLFGLYDDLNTLEPDNPYGIRMAAIVQQSNSSATYDVELQQVLAALARVGASAGGPAWVRIQTDALALAIRMTGSPQFLAIYQEGMKSGHAIIAHGIETGDVLGVGHVRVSDPNHPGVERTVMYSGERFFEYLGSTYSGGPVAEYPHIFVAGVTAMMAMPGMNANWAALEAKTIGQGQYPATVFEYRDPVDTVWRAAGETVRTASTGLMFRTRCPSCPAARGPDSKEQQRVLTLIYNDAGGDVGNDNPDAAEGVNVTLTMGATKFGYEVRGAPKADSDWRFIDFTWFTIERVPFEVSVTPAAPRPGEQVTYRVTNGGVGDASSRYRWIIGDEEPVITDFSTRELTQLAPEDVAFQVRVELIDPSNHLLAKGELYVGGAPFWRITSIADHDKLFEDEISGGGEIGQLLERVLAVPTSGAITAEEVGGGTQLRLRVLRGGAWNPDDCCPLPAFDGGREYSLTLGAMPQQNFSFGPFFSGWGFSSWSQSTEELFTGTMTGQHVLGTASYRIRDAGTQTGPAGGARFTASRNGMTMTGTITLTIWWVDEDDGLVHQTGEDFRFPFTAVRMK